MYKSKWPVFTEKMIENVTKVLQSGKVNQWTGSRVREFEDKFSKYLGVAHAVAVFNGSVALELCLKAIDLQKDDEVIVTPRTFIASVSSINICGGQPVFVDVDPISQNITLENIKKAVTNKTKAVILVHLAGWPCDLEEIVQWCHLNKIYVIEDCAQAHGSKYKGKHVGTWGDINAWSFCQDKIITTGGEGGMVTTNDETLFKRAWSYKDHGKNYDKIKTVSIPGFFKWVHDSFGTNWRMTEMQASIGIDALEKLDEWVYVRRKNASILNDVLKKSPAIRLTIPSDEYYHSYYKYYCFVKTSYLKDGCSRDTILTELNNNGIPCFQGTCGEVYKEQAYGLKLDLAITKSLTETTLMFLVDPSYDSDTMRNMAEVIKNIIDKHTKFIAISVNILS